MDSHHDPQASWLRRYQCVLWRQHQPLIARLVLLAAISVAIYFARRAYQLNGLIDIDEAPARQADYRVDINTAEWPEIVVLPGVGEKLARSIVDYRNKFGPFDSLDSVESVPGIGASKLNQLRPFLLPIKR